MKKSDISSRAIVIFTKLVFDTDACIEWQGARFENGYGAQLFITNGVKRTYRAHRLSYAIFKGEVPDNLRVCHTCDNPPCVNPKHLFLGTTKENQEDSISKGRSDLFKTGKKESARLGIKKSKLSFDMVCDIRRLNKEGVSMHKLGRDYGVSYESVWQIVHNKIRINA